MMTVPMDNASAITPADLAQRLYDKNVELGKKFKKSVNSKIPADPIRWRQMRQNYEAIILADSDFSESHEIEHLLWQLHYRCIEEFRARLRSSSATAAAVQAQGGGEAYVRRESRNEIHSFFKSFLTEATGFYHDLILKIKSKLGVPLDQLSDGIDNETKDEKTSTDKKKILMSWHRCLIYLGDLARYTELYGEGDLSNRNYAVASSFYTQAASMWPSSGNPHHQLAILASYLGEDLMIVYRYFRSLAVQSPCSTARDNLIILFEKNRQSYTQLLSYAKSSSIKMHNARISGKGRGRGETRLLARDHKREVLNYKEKAIGNSNTYKNFCIRFVRLNGILFTQVFASVINDLLTLLSSGPEEELSFGADIAENALVIVRLIAILIFTVHNVNKDIEGQSYAEILQRSVLLQNAFVAAFEFVGHILKRCVELKDVSASYLLPSVLVFIEWLACHLDIAGNVDGEEKQVAARSFFWRQCISFLNKLIENGLVSVDAGDSDACFYDTSVYDENEPGGRVALSEDFELRGFLPLQPAHLILDFSKKHSAGIDKAKVARVQRFFAAGRALMGVAQVDQQGAYFDNKLKKFVVGAEPQISEEVAPTFPDTSKPAANMESLVDDVRGLQASISNCHLLDEVEEEDEVIVFKPTVAEKRADMNSLKSIIDNHLSAELPLKGGLGTNVPVQTSLVQPTYNVDVRPPSASMGFIEGQVPPSNSTAWLLQPQLSGVNRMTDFMVAGNGLSDDVGISHPMSFAPSLSGNLDKAALPSQSCNQLKVVESMAALPTQSFNQLTVVESMIPSKLDTIMPAVKNSIGFSSHTSSLSTISKKNPVGRPVRHMGPPPGFGPVPPKPQDEAKIEISGSDEHPLLDDYTWLDGYGHPSANATELSGGLPQTSNAFSADRSNWNAINGFPFPGKQLPGTQVDMANLTRQHPVQLLEQLKLLHGQQPQQNVLMGSNVPGPLQEQHKGQSLWSGQYLVSESIPTLVLEDSVVEVGMQPSVSEADLQCFVAVVNVLYSSNGALLVLQENYVRLPLKVRMWPRHWLKLGKAEQTWELNEILNVTEDLVVYLTGDWRVEQS
ncbi:SMG7 protein [Nymphaea thermarum]|nr:SMG7 protein [Nymphaea thermarum]